MAGKQVLLTFGLLSPNKGIEYALPDIISEFPNTVYIVLGQGVAFKNPKVDK